MSLLQCKPAIVFAFAAAASIGQDCATTGALRNPDMIQLPLPRPAAAGEVVAVELRLGRLAAGARLRVLGESGDVLGVVAPFGRSLEGTTTTHSVPLPPGAIRDGRIRLRLVLEQPNAEPRAPGPAEVESVNLIYVPVPKS